MCHIGYRVAVFNLLTNPFITNEKSQLLDSIYHNLKHNGAKSIYEIKSETL